MIERYSISNETWSYIVNVENGIITSCNKSPNNRNHWCVGWTIDDIKKYYNQNELLKELNTRTQRVKISLLQ